jgi:multidrug efflux pump subunit AcrA (membrane-fusion protein)
MSTRTQQREKRIRSTELLRKLREDPTYREKEAQMARRRYKQKQEQLQALREQLRYQQELIYSSQQKIQSMTFSISELETALNKAFFGGCYDKNKFGEVDVGTGTNKDRNEPKLLG